MGLSNTISAAINKNVPCVNADDNLHSVVNAMAQAGASALVVMSNGEVIGLITTMDVMNSVAKHNDLAQTLVSESMTPCSLIADKAVKTPCVQLDEDENVGNALAIMNEAGVHNLMVTGSNNQAIGTVSVLDLLKLAVA